MVNGAPVVAANLKRIGINAEIENVEYAVWIKRWLAKDFDMTMNTTPGYGDPDTAFFRALHATKGQNWNSSSPSDLDGMLEEGRRTFDQKRRKEIYDKVQIMILEQRAAPLALLGRSHRLQPELCEGLGPAPDDEPVRLRARLARQGVEARIPGPGAAAAERLSVVLYACARGQASSCPRREARRGKMWRTRWLAWPSDGSSAGSIEGAVPMPWLE